MFVHSSFSKQLRWSCILIMPILLCTSFSILGLGKDKPVTKFDGYLFSKLDKIGSKSEGPIYFLQKWNYLEIIVVKKVPPWKEDPQIHKFLGKKVTIEGDLRQGRIHYKKILDLQPPTQVAAKVGEKPTLEICLKLEAEVLWVDKEPSTEPSLEQSMDLTLMVKWPYRSIWEGSCPTTQIYDFFIERNGNIIWQWSKGKTFLQVQTPVSIPGGDSKEFPVTWSFLPSDIKEEGTYTARAVFIASKQETSKDFEIKFAH